MIARTISDRVPHGRPIAQDRGRRVIPYVKDALTELEAGK